MRRLHILLSSFACVPGGGSEGGIGWTWAETLSRDHDVVVLTDRSYKEAIEAEMAAHPRQSLTFAYLGGGRRGDGGLGIYPYYYRWQRLALPAAKRLHSRRAFDVAHHVTYGSFRVPSYLHRLGIPFIWGPVGGGEEAPLGFLHPKWIGWRESVNELVRIAWNREVTIDPRLRATVRGATLNAFTTEQSRAAFPAAINAVVLSNSHLPAADIAALSRRRAQRPPPTGMRVLFVGRLLGWKGPTLALHAFARYAAVFPDARLSMVGEGPLSGALARLAEVLGIADAVSLRGRIPRSEVLQAYADHHCFLFPSLHDSSGFVVLEAMAAGLPVVHLDLGGPGELVPRVAGVKVPAHSPKQAISDLSDALVRLTRDEALWQRAADGGRAHALDPQSPLLIESKRDLLYGRLGLL